jgi:hypothetical protein
LVAGVLLTVGLAASTGRQQPVRKTTAPPKLTATVSASGEVTLTTSDGRALTRLPSGRYTVLVSVNSGDADFHLTGPAVNHATHAHFIGVALWGVHFVKGTYRYTNDRGPHGAGTTHVVSVY